MQDPAPAEGAGREGLYGVPVPEALAPLAEEVRRWFVQLRGGGPFLSAPDGSTLVAWLEAGVSVSAICMALDQVATRRLARRTRTPFCLIDVQATLTTVLKSRNNFQWRSARAPVAETIPAPVLPTTLRTRVESAEAAALTSLEAALAALTAGDPEADPEKTATAAIALVSRYFDELWHTLGPEQPRLLAEAADELCELRNVVGADSFNRMCEERARAHLRRRHPALSVTRLWEVYGGAGRLHG